MITIKNGRERRVQVSVFDALRGGRTLRRPKKPIVEGPPVQVGPTIVHTLPTASEPAAAAPATTEVPAPAPAPASAPADPSTIETAPGWTAADDEKLLHLKAGGKTWKDIHAEMGGKRAIKDIKRRCNDLNKVKATSEGTEAGKEAEAKAAETKEDTGKQQTKEDSTESGQRPIIYLDEGDELDVHEIMYLYRLQEHFDDKKWLDIASRFFDQTGKRIDPIQLKGKLGG
ncbi:hypothetical protein MMC09_003524 [Bachmanniomyces sp. S44760]|nr:hypothetical protein [Bachmanniomyces sp. S44760]